MPRHEPKSKASTPRDPALDGLRGFAVFLVFLFHYAAGTSSPHVALRFLGHVAEAGWIGVTIFFALSGFLITGELWDSRAQPRYLRHYFARRALRLLPLYVFVLLVTFVLAIGHGSTVHDVHDLIIYVFFGQDLPVLSFLVSLLILPVPLFHLWSLAVEAQFYIAWPLLLRLPHTRNGALRLSLGTFAASVLFILLAYGVPFFEHATPHSFDLFPLTHAGAFGLGAALALLARSGHWPLVQSLAPRALVCAVLVFAGAGFAAGGCTFTHRPVMLFGMPAAAVAAAALVGLAFVPASSAAAFGPLRRWLVFRPLRELGLISYGVYVFHIVLLPISDSLAARLAHAAAGFRFGAVRFGIAFCLTILAAWLSFHLLELPFLQLKRKFPLHRPLPAPPLPQPAESP